MPRVSQAGAGPPSVEVEVASYELPGQPCEACQHAMLAGATSCTACGAEYAHEPDPVVPVVVTEPAKPKATVPKPAPKATVPKAVVPVLSPAQRLAAALGGDVAADISEQAAEPVEWLWHGVIAKGDAAEVSGPTTSGKSTLSFLLAVASVADRPIALCGRAVAQLPTDLSVLLVNVEQAKKSIQRKLREAAIALGVDPAVAMARIVVIGRELEGLFHGGTRSEIWHKMSQQRDGIGLTILDSRARLLKGDSDSEADQVDAAAVVGLFTRDGATVVVISHVRKSAGREGATQLEDVAGHHQRGAAADCILLVQARMAPNGEVLSSTVRVAKRRDDGGEQHPEPMRYTIDRSGAVPRLLDGAEADRQAGLPEPRELVLARLVEAAEPVTLNRLSDELGLRKPLVRDLLSELKRAGQVWHVPVKIGGRTFTAYRATDRAVLTDAGIVHEAANDRPSTGRAPDSTEQASGAS